MNSQLARSQRKERAEVAAKRCAICRRERKLRRGPEPLYSLGAALRTLGVRKGIRVHISCLLKLERSLRRREQKTGRTRAEILA